MCGEKKKGGTRWGCLSFVVKDIVSQRAWHRVTLIQILVSILTAIGTTLGVTSCMGYGPIAML